MRTGGRFEAKTPFTDGVIEIGAQDFQVMSGVTSTFVKAGKGLVTLHIGASLAPVIIVDLGAFFTRKLGLAPFLQEQFGTAAGVAGPTSVANTSDPDAQSGIPPFTGASQLTPQKGFFPKGINILDVTLQYAIAGAALTGHTIGISKTVFANNAAPVVTDVLANAANGLATATQAQPYVTKIAVNSGFLVTDLTHYILELDPTTQVAGTYDLSGATLHVSYNWN